MLALAGLPLGAATDDLEGRLRESMPATRIQVVEVDGIVLLRGTVTTAGERIAAERLTRGAGYERVANLLRVVAPPTDEEIRVGVERSMRDLRALGLSRDVSIRTENGVVHLNGTFPDEARQPIVDVIRRIDGVQSVVLNGVRAL